MFDSYELGVLMSLWGLLFMGIIGLKWRLDEIQNTLDQQEGR